VARICGQRPEKQKLLSAFIVAIAAGCILPRLKTILQAMIATGDSHGTPWGRIWKICLVLLFIGACAMKPALLHIEGLDHPLAIGTIYDTARGKTIDFNDLLQQLAPVRVVYVGERHTDASHHQIQLRIIQALVDRGRKVRVGMEMFDHTYQERLDQWSAGQMEWDAFLKRSHWYANWKFDDGLYKDILIYIKEKQLKLIGLNIPFHIPRKISVGGLDNLMASERALLPEKIDTTHTEHRAYVEKIFKMHRIKGRDDFENFYTAQCAWEDGMAQSVADNLKNDTMVVIAGNGHIKRKFGIPNRAYKRTGAPFRTIYPVSPHEQVSLEDGDFIWVTAETGRKSPH
jgi:uncharacterized iron-regulated protein